MAMKVLLYFTLLAMSNMAVGQLWNDPSNGITVKTVYVPLRKGSNSIPIPDFSRVRPLATLSLPNHSSGGSGGGGGGGGDYQVASSVNQNFRPKVNMLDTHVHALQDVRAKISNHLFKSDVHSHGSNYPNFNQGNNYPQQAYGNPHQQQPMISTVNHHSQGQHHFYQPEPVSNYLGGHPQNAVQKNNTPIQHQSNINLVMHEGHLSATGGKISNFHNPTSYGQQVYANDNIMIQRIPSSNIPYSQFHNSQNPTQQTFHRGNSANHESLSSSQSTDPNNSGESSRHFHQTQTDANPSHQLYIATPNQNPSYAPGHHQLNYGIQNEQNTHHIENVIRGSNGHQGFHNQDNRYVVPAANNHQQQPVNTYAIVHQRVPNSNSAIQNNKAPTQSEHIYHRQVYDTRSLNSPTSYMNNEPTSSNQEQVHFQLASQNQQLKVENPQNSLDNQQYQMKQISPVNIDNQLYNGHQVAPHVQIMMPQIPQSQQDSSEAQYVSQQQSSPSHTDIQNQDSKNIQQQTSMTPTHTSYPDPSSETYYQENKQVYVSPPPDYGSHGHQQQPPVGDQAYVRYPSHVENNSQNNQLPISIQTGQVGVHVTLPTRNYGYQDQSKYNNGYA